VAGVAALAMLEALNSDAGFEIEINAPEAVLGVAPVQRERFCINELLGRPLKSKIWYNFTQGEKLARGMPC
jgi:homoserine kinase